MRFVQMFGCRSRAPRRFAALARASAALLVSSLAAGCTKFRPSDTTTSTSAPLARERRLHRIDVGDGPVIEVRARSNGSVLRAAKIVSSSGPFDLRNRASFVEGVASFAWGTCSRSMHEAGFLLGLSEGASPEGIESLRAALVAQSGVESARTLMDGCAWTDEPAPSTASSPGNAETLVVGPNAHRASILLDGAPVGGGDTLDLAVPLRWVSLAAELPDDAAKLIRPP
jgi:hypothetical protein